MMKFIRGVIRVIGVAVVTIGLFACWLGVKLITKGDALMRWRTRLFRAWGTGCAKVCGVRITHEGTAPPQPSFWVCNHLSSLDAIMVCASVHNPMVVARHDMAQWPLIGAMTSSLGMIFVNRDRFDVMPDVAMQMERALKAGYTVVMFPEATTSKGNNLLPFKAPLFEPAVRVGVPVHYGCLHYSTAPSEPPASDVVNWWRDVSFAAHAWTYLQTPYINARLRYGTDCILADNRKQLARKLQEAVQTLFEPM